MNNKKNIIDENTDIKRIVFFAFYIIFFIFVSFLIKGGLSNSQVSVTRNNSGLNKSYNLKSLKNNNYHFNYLVNKNNEVTIFDGDRNKDITMFVKSGDISTYYYSENDNYYERNNNTLKYEGCNNPIEFSNITDIKMLEKIITHSTYVSITDYFSGKEKDYNYIISTSTLIRYIENTHTDISDDGNKIIVKTDEDDNVYEIDLDLTNYYKYYDDSIDSYLITLSYSKYNEIGNLSVNK